jgi:hypothetical protein
MKLETMLHARNPHLHKMLANKWGILNSTILIQDKADQVNLVVRQTEIADTLNNGQFIEIANTPNNRHIEIADTLNNGQSEEDLILESTMCEEASQQAAEANLSFGEYVMNIRKVETKEPNLLIMLKKPESEKSLKDMIPEWYHEYLDVFSEKEAIPLPLHCLWDHVVKLVPDAPPSISCRVYPLSCAEEEFQAKYIDEQEAAGLIQKLKSLYLTPIFYIKKKNRSFRPIFDYQKINAITVKDVFLLPCIDTIIKGIRSGFLFSQFNLCNSYWNVCNTKETEDLMAFKTTRGLYAPRVMSFGLTNAPACMQ